MKIMENNNKLEAVEFVKLNKQYLIKYLFHKHNYKHLVLLFSIKLITKQKKIYLALHLFLFIRIFFQK